MAGLSGHTPSAELQAIINKGREVIKQNKFERAEFENFQRFGKAVDNEYTIGKTEKENNLIQYITYAPHRYMMDEGQQASRGIKTQIKIKGKIKKIPAFKTTQNFKIYNNLFNPGTTHGYNYNESQVNEFFNKFTKGKGFKLHLSVSYFVYDRAIDEDALDELYNKIPVDYTIVNQLYGNPEHTFTKSQDSANVEKDHNESKTFTKIKDANDYIRAYLLDKLQIIALAVSASHEIKPFLFTIQMFSDPLFELGAGKLPQIISAKRSKKGLDKYEDECCVYRSIAVALGADERYCKTRTLEIASQYMGKTYTDLNQVPAFRHDEENYVILEEITNCGINVYECQINNEKLVVLLNRESSEFVGKPLMKANKFIDLGIYNNHCFVITDINQFCPSVACEKCGNEINKTSYRKHKLTCNGGKTKIEFVEEPITIFESCSEKLNEGHELLYPFHIEFDFESLQPEHREQKKKGNDLSILIDHVPISCTVSDTYTNKATTHINIDPKKLIHDVYADIKNRSWRIRNIITLNKHKYFATTTIEKLENARKEWIFEVPVIGFNSGGYDIPLIKNYLYDEIYKTQSNYGKAKEIQVVMKGEAKNIVVLIANGNKFIDVMNFIQQGVDYDNWLKLNNSAQQKSFFPYEWFDSYEKLNYPGLPEYEDWYSKLKRNILTMPEYWECCRIFEEKGMRTFKDWLIYYNELDVVPMGKAVTNMQKTYFNTFKQDILKDSITIGSVTLRYGISETQKQLITNEDILMYSPTKEVYNSLIKGKSGGLSLIMTRKMKQGQPIKSHIYGDQSLLCDAVIGFDENGEYLGATGMEMPYGKSRLDKTTYENNPKQFMTDIMNGFKCYAIVDIRISPDHPDFNQYEQFPLIIVPNVIIPDEIISDKMRHYRDERNNTNVKSGKLMSTNCAIQAALISDYIKYLIEKGAEVTKVHEIVVFEKYGKIFNWFKEAVTKARQTGDDINQAYTEEELRGKTKEELKEIKEALEGYADSMKLAGNTFYGKSLEDITKYINTLITSKSQTISKKYNSPLFVSADGVVSHTEIDEDGTVNNYCSCVEIKMKKNKIKVNRHIAIGIYVYQYSKLILLRLIHDFLFKHFPDKCIALTHCDTDSIYFGLAGETPEQKEIIRAIIKMDKKKDFVKVANAMSCLVENKYEYFNDCNKFLVMDISQIRVPGLAKLEHVGTSEVALCSKMYAIDGGKGYKSTNKGISKKNTDDTKFSNFEDCIDDFINMQPETEGPHYKPQLIINRGFKKTKENTVVTYEQRKLGLSAYYDKRYTLEDGINTKPYTEWYEQLFHAGIPLSQPSEEIN